MEFIVGLIKSNRESNTNKFYIITTEENKITIKWGRIGTVGRYKTFDQETKESAMKFAVKKKREKLKKGYSEYPVDKILQLSKDEFIESF